LIPPPTGLKTKGRFPVWLTRFHKLSVAKKQMEGKKKAKEGGFAALDGEWMVDGWENREK